MQACVQRRRQRRDADRRTENGGSGNDFRAGIARAIAQNWLWRYESGTYVKFPQGRSVQ
jgi:hypothetical protein